MKKNYASLCYVILCLLIGINAKAANYYWVGNGGNWNDFADHWATTSGGNTFASAAPTSADNVFFDANSFSCCITQTVTINVAAVCNNMVWMGVTNTPTFTDPGNGLSIYGSLTLVSGMTLNLNGVVNFLATTTGQTITTANQTFNGSITFNGAGGGWTLQDSLKEVAAAGITLTAGTLNTNGETVSCAVFYSTGALTRVLNMGASVFNLGYNIYSGYCWDVSGTGLTINAGTSVINGPANATITIVFYGGGQTYNTVNFLSSVTAGYSATINDNSTYNNVTLNGNGKITGTNTFNNLTFSPGFTYILPGGLIQTITGSLTANGTCTGRIFIQSSSSSAVAIISKASGTVTLSDVTLTGMFATGGATFTANNSIDGGNNTNWTINAVVAHNLYWIGNGGNWNDPNHWSLTSGGTPYGCYPSSAGVQDNVFFDANSFSCCVPQTVTINVAATCNNMNWTGVTNNPTFTDPGNGLSVYGSLTFVSGMTVNLNGAVNFLATTTGQTITTANKTISGSISFNGAGGGWTLQDSLKAGASATITLTSGTLNTNGKAVSCEVFYSTGALTRVLNMGASVFNLGYNIYSEYCWDVSGTSLTINAGTSVINGPANATAAIVFYGGGQTYNNVNFLSSATAAYSATINDNSAYNNVTFYGNGKITGSNTFSTLTFSPGCTYILTGGQIQTITTNLVANGTCTGRIYIQSSSTTAVAIISKASGTITLTDVTLTWMFATGDAIFNINNSIDGGNNMGWNITAPVSHNLYWIGNSGNWNDGTHWSLTSGGTPYGCYPSSAGVYDNVFFDANSFDSTGKTVTINVAAICNNITWTGVTNTPTFTDPGNGLSVYGSSTFVSGMTVNLNGAVNFLSTTTGQTITTGNKTISGSITFNGIGGGWTLQDSLKAGASATITLTSGTLNTNGEAVSCEVFYSTGTLTRALNMGASAFNLGYNIYTDYCWDVSGTGLTINAGTSIINGPANATAAISFYGGGQTYNNVNFLSSATAAYSATINDNSTYNNVTFNGNGKITGTNTFSALTFSPGYTYTLTSGQTQTIANSFSASGTCTAGITIGSSTNAVSTISKASGAVTLSYVTLSWNAATGGATFTANNSVNAGNNNGWVIGGVTPVNLYWIGNSGNWNDPNHWSLTSGGAAYGCTPRDSDNVLFDANSFDSTGKTVTINVAAVCHNINWTGVTNTPTFTDPGNGLSIYGSLTFASGMTVNLNGAVNFLATATGQTITTANKPISGSIAFNGAGGGWTLQDSLKAGASATITLTAGTLNANGEEVSCQVFYSTGALTRVLNMGASVFNLGYNVYSDYCWDVSGTGLTINAGTSVINGPANATAAILFYGGGQTYNNVKFLSSATGAYSATINDNSTYNNVTYYGNGKITGTNTFDSLTFSPGYAYTLTSGQTQTITSGFIANGTCTERIYIQSATAAASTISMTSGTVTVNYATITWMTATGGATFNADNSIDGGNNTGWNFTAPVSRNLYWIGNSGNWNDGTHWSLTSGGAPLGCYPSSSGIYDNVFFDANSFSLPTQTVTLNVAAICNNMTWTGALYTPVITDPGNGLSVYGSLTLISGMTVNLNGPVNFLATMTGQTITTANKTISGSIAFNGTGGGWTLQDSLKAGASATITLTAGTLNTNGEEVSCQVFYSTGALTRVLNMGASVFNLGYNIYTGYCWDVSGTGLTINAGTSVINGPPNPAAISFFGGGQTYNNINFLSSGPSVYSAIINDNSTYNNVTFYGNGKITGTNTFDTLTFSPGYTYILTNGQTQTVNSGFIATGTCTGRIYIQSATTTGVSVIRKLTGTVTVDYVTMTWMGANGGATFNADNSIDGRNNTGWNFTAPVSHNLYWIGNAGNWNDPNHWSLTSGGTPYGCYPSSAGVNDNVFFDANSFSLPTQTVTLNVAAVCNNMTWTGALYTPAITDPGNGLSVYGSLTLISGMTVNLNGAVNFLATTTGQTITTANKTISGSITFNGVGGGWTLQDSLKGGASANITLTAGTLNTNGEAVSCEVFYSTGALTRVLNMGASVFNLGYNIYSEYCWDVSGTGLTINAGTSVINGPANATTAISFYGGGQTYNDVNFLSSATAGYSATINNNNTFNNVAFYGNGDITGTNTFDTLTFSPGFTYILTNGQTQTIGGALIANGTCSKQISIKSSLTTAVSVIGKASGAITINYCTLTWMGAAGAATFTANNSVDGGNNEGWIINAVPGAPTISINGNILQSSSATGNQWYRNSNIINGATSQFYTATVSGVYTVVDTSGGCTYTSAPFSFIYTGIAENGNVASLLVYPNPASTDITIQSGLLRATNGVAVSVINVLGERIPVTRLEIEGDKATINISGLPAGIYFLLVKTDSGTAMKRFVKE